jgi:hypothetical protein
MRGVGILSAPTVNNASFRIDRRKIFFCRAKIATVVAHVRRIGGLDCDSHRSGLVSDNRRIQAPRARKSSTNVMDRSTANCSRHNNKYLRVVTLYSHHWIARS